MKLKKLYTKLIEKIEPVLEMHHVDLHKKLNSMRVEILDHIALNNTNDVERFNLLENKIMLLEEKLNDQKMHDLRSGDLESGEPVYDQSPLLSWAAERFGGSSDESLRTSEGERNLSEPESKIEIDSKLTEITLKYVEPDKIAYANYMAEHFDN